MTSSARRLTKVTDLSELMEELAMAIFEFLSLVFTFACTIYMIETLGNPIGWYDADDQRLSFLRSLWFVVVTVSTVGYGDFTPTSILGRLCGMVLILVGVLFFGNKTGQIVGLLESTKNGAGSFSRKGKPHVVLTGKVTTSALRNFCLEFFHPDHFGQGGDEWSVCLLTNPIMAVNDLVEDNVAPDLKVGALAGSILSKSDAARAKISKAHVSTDLVPCFMSRSVSATSLKFATDYLFEHRPASFSLRPSRHSQKMPTEKRCSGPCQFGSLHSIQAGWCTSTCTSHR